LTAAWLPRVADHHARHQAQQFGDVAGAAGVDQFAVEHGHAAGHGRRGLFQACGGQNLRQRLTVEEQIVGQHGANPNGSNSSSNTDERGRAKTRHGLDNCG
jgi:hypothetical protein